MYLVHFDHLEQQQQQQQPYRTSPPPMEQIVHPTAAAASPTPAAATTTEEQQQPHNQSRRPSYVDVNALSRYAAATEETPKPIHCHKRQQPSIDVNTCRRKLSLYGDNQSQIIPFEKSAEQAACYYHPDTGCIQSKSLLDIQHGNLGLQELLTKDRYWIDIMSPSVSEMKMISQIFRIHPLTIEDILSQETREKCDVFRGYLFVCYRAFVQDGQVLKPVSFYNIVFKKSILSFHFSSIPQLNRVYQRVDHLQNYMSVTSDWINYAILDEVTDQFAPLMHQLEADVDSIDDPAMLLKVNHDETEMVMRIGACRKRVMQLYRLLASKADVVKALIKRLQESSGNGSDNKVGGLVDAPPTSMPGTMMQHHSMMGHRRGGSSSSFGFIKDHKGSNTTKRHNTTSEEERGNNTLPDVSLYLGDVQDHLITMLQNLSHYETVLARAHSNYLAQISIKLSQTSNSTNDVIGRLTVFATILLPMNLVTGLWGMNVKVPGKDYDDLLYFFWIVASLALFAIGAFTLARRFQFF
ncbi:hypothetical protein O0I10_004450 [Lichtheimia ornata]|uniref:Cora-domain-containing protein n=1 Tax=Lichtheimia ornata TaxID=688661 RepID=A0AAD7Y261_9FUNG|nr:uncharacterized protein O0I10_004450 [Lichtheimia ornata]KAJ8659857.1 hypothetical protein O0I10_004450 [Lichtheimia ornata]